jgi:hypothetical protein
MVQKIVIIVQNLLLLYKKLFKKWFKYIIIKKWYYVCINIIYSICGLITYIETSL